MREPVLKHFHYVLSRNPHLADTDFFKQLAFLLQLLVRIMHDLKHFIQLFSYEFELHKVVCQITSVLLGLLTPNSVGFI